MCGDEVPLVSSSKVGNDYFFLSVDKVKLFEIHIFIQSLSSLPLLLNCHISLSSMYLSVIYLSLCMCCYVLLEISPEEPCGNKSIVTPR